MFLVQRSLRPRPLLDLAAYRTQQRAGRGTASVSIRSSPSSLPPVSVSVLPAAGCTKQRQHSFFCLHFFEKKIKNLCLKSIHSFWCGKTHPKKKMLTCRVVYSPRRSALLPPPPPPPTGCARCVRAKRREAGGGREPHARLHVHLSRALHKSNAPDPSAKAPGFCFHLERITTLRTPIQ